MKVAHEDVPRRLAVDGGEFGGVVVVASAHAVEGELVGDFVELLGGREPFIGGLGGNAGNHDVGVADGLVQLDRFIDFCILHAVPRGVPSAAYESRLLQEAGVEIRAELRGAREFDAVVAHGLDGFQGGQRIFREFLSDGVHFEGDWNDGHDCFLFLMWLLYYYKV